MLAEAAVQGRTVLHSKQVLESLTGRVSIEHLSENNFGSLMPNRAWRHAKRVIDFLSALILLPFLCPLFLAIAAWIRIDRRGPPSSGSCASAPAGARSASSSSARCARRRPVEKPTPPPR
ncbi:hypothetical protein ACFSTI_27685 [Rhizorhabdus histidinilytica]